MKKLWTCLIQSSVLVAGIVCGARAFAQEPGFPPETPAPPPKQGPTSAHHGTMDSDEQLARMTARYSLTTEQQDHVKPLLVDQQQQMQLLHLDSSLSSDEKKAKMRTIRDESDKKIEAILNDDQKKQFDQDHQSTQERMRQQGQGGSGPTTQQ